MRGIRYRYQSWSRGRRNERNRKILERGKLPRRDRVTAGVKSRTPVYRERINRGTGRPHRDDAQMARTQDRSLSQWKRTREAIPARTQRGRTR